MKHRAIIARRAGPPRVYLRPLRPEDATKRYLAWLRDPEVACWIRSGQPSTLAELRELVRRWCADRASCLPFAICLRGTGEHIGNLKLERARTDYGTKRPVVEIGLMIGAKRHRGRGYGWRAIRLGVQAARRWNPEADIVAGIDKDNDASKLAFLFAGFSLEIPKLHAWYRRALRPSTTPETARKP